MELLLARTDTDAVLVTHLRAYPTGLEFSLTARPHPDQLQQRGHDPDRPHRLLYRTSGWHSTHWLWGLPPPGPLTFVLTWPASQLPTSAVEIDASLVLEAADRAVPAWPTG